MEPDQTFASSSVPRHLVRGLIGIAALAGSLLLIPITGIVSLLLIPIGLVAMRGCPTCWTIGLAQTISIGRWQRECSDASCRLTSQ